MSETALFEVVRGVDGMCLYMNEWRVAGEKPLCEIKPMFRFKVKKNDLLNKLFRDENSYQLSIKDFVKPDSNHSHYSYVYGNINIRIYKLKKSKWCLDVTSKDMFIQKTCSSFTECLIKLPLLLGISQ